MPTIVAWAFTDLEDLKSFLGIAGSTTAHDDLLENLINGASGFIEAYTNRRLKSTVYNSATLADRKFTWYDGDNTKSLFLREYPITAVSAVTVSGATISAASAADYYGSTGYVIHHDRGELFYANHWEAGKQNIRVSYTAGYLSTDREWFELQELCRSFVAWVFNNRTHLGFKSERLMNYTYTLADVRKVGGQHLATLNRYRRKIVT